MARQVNQGHQSPNFNERPPRAQVDMLVLHYTGMKSGEAALKRLCDADAKVSAHYLVFEDGQIFALVDEAHRAWHAGVAYWKGETDINGRSIGIEIVNPGHEWGYRAFPEVQIDTLINLCRDISARHPIKSEGVLAHSDVAPDRKTDPGELFPWDRLADQGIGRWTRPEEVKVPRGLTILQPGSQAPDVGACQNALKDIGYRIVVTGHFDTMTSNAVAAFQRRFRPAKIDGLLDPQTQVLLQHYR